MNYKVWVLIGIALLSPAVGRGDGTSYVAMGGGHIVPYDNWDRAATNLHAAVATAAASNWTTVLVSNGWYGLTGEVVVAKAMTVRSWHAGALDLVNTIIDANNYAGKPVTNRSFYLSHSNAVVDGFTMTNGTPIPFAAANGGGAVLIMRGTVQNSIMRQNSACAGGGVQIRGTGTVVNCTIQSNICSPGNAGGGGVFVDSLMSGLISNCLVSDNTAHWAGGGINAQGDHSEIVNCAILRNILTNRSGGGGVYLYSMAATNGYLLRNCTVAGNSVTLGVTTPNGGGICCFRIASGAIENCIITNNYSAESGGGIYLDVSTGRVVNCLIAGNTARLIGGGIHQKASKSPMEILNCTVVSNRTEIAGAYFGGGVYLDGGGMTNTIIYGNILAGGGSASNYLITTNSFCSFCCSMQTNPIPGDNNLNTNPLFVALSAGDYRLSAASPCLNAGTNQDWMQGTCDLDGHRRIDAFIGRADMGAYEFCPSGVMVKIR